MVEMAAIYSPVEHMSVSRGAHMVAGTCAPAPPSPGFLSFTGWDGAVEGLTAAQRRSGVTVRVRCAAASGIPCRGRTRVRTARRYARAGGKRARVTFAGSAVSLAPGTSRVVRLKLRKAGRRLIDKQRRVKAEVTAVTTDPSGAPIAKTLPLVLRAAR
jgi:hypothetical protein